MYKPDTKWMKQKIHFFSFSLSLNRTQIITHSKNEIFFIEKKTKTKRRIQKTCTLNQRKSRSPHTHSYTLLFVSVLFLSKEMRWTNIDASHMVNKQLYKLFNLVFFFSSSLSLFTFSFSMNAQDVRLLQIDLNSSKSFTLGHELCALQFDSLCAGVCLWNKRFDSIE